MVCQRCSKTAAEGEKFCIVCGASLSAGSVKPMSRLEKIKLAGKAAYCIAVVGAAAASSMSGAYIPAAGLGDDGTAPVKKEVQLQNKPDRK